MSLFVRKHESIDGKSRRIDNVLIVTVFVCLLLSNEHVLLWSCNPPLSFGDGGGQLSMI